MTRLLLLLHLVGALVLASCSPGPSQDTSLSPEALARAQERCRALALSLCGESEVLPGLRALHSPEAAEVLEEEEARARRGQGEPSFWEGVWVEPGLYCAFGCEPAPPEAAPACQDHAGCPEGLSCEQGRCVFLARCSQEEACPAPQSCVDGLCIQICDEQVSCAWPEERQPRWCQEGVAQGRVREGQCVAQELRCDQEGTVAQVHCAARGQGCVSDRCMDASRPPLDLDDGLVHLPAARFWMGSGPEEAGRGQDEGLREVALEGELWVQRTEVTQGQWFARMRQYPPDQASCGADCPVSGVSWWDALAYANALSDFQGLPRCFALEGCNEQAHGQGFACASMRVTAPGGDPYACEGYRLPTEAEWEFFARAGTQSAFWSGALGQEGCQALDPALDQAGWYAANAQANHPGCQVRTGCAQEGGCLGVQAVGQRAANAFGLFDVHGNVAEWTLDAYHPSPQATSNPWHDDPAAPRVLRGGSWSDQAQACRAAARHSAPPQEAAPTRGFRLVRRAAPVLSCGEDDACGAGRCAQGRCVAEHCADGRWDPALESALDCGLGCAPCPTGATCRSSDDCQGEAWCDRGHCTPRGFLWAPPGQVQPQDRERPLEQSRALWVQKHEAFGPPFEPRLRWPNARQPSFIHWRNMPALANALSLAQGLEPCYLRATTRLPVAQGDDGQEMDLWWPAGERCLGYRLATGEEWEYLARAGSPYKGYLHDLDPHGPEPWLTMWSNYQTRSNLQPVGQKLPNAWNLHDMMGNAADKVWNERWPEVGEGPICTRGGSDFYEFDWNHLHQPSHCEGRGVYMEGNPRWVRTTPQHTDCAEGCLDAGCRESPHRTWVADQVEGLAPGPAGSAALSQPGGASWQSDAAQRQPRDASWRRVLEHGPQVFALLPSGDLWRVSACTTAQPQGQRVAQRVLDFMPHEGWLYTLEEGGRLGRSPLDAPGDASLLHEGVEAFAVNDQALWTLDAQGTLWRHPHDGSQAQQEAQEVEQVQAVGDALYTLTRRGCLWEQRGEQRRPLDAHRQAFTLSADALYVLHESGHLWRLHHRAPCPAAGCQEPSALDSLFTCLETAIPERSE